MFPETGLTSIWKSRRVPWAAVRGAELSLPWFVPSMKTGMLEGVKTAVGQAVSKFAALTLPRPVA